MAGKPQKQFKQRDEPRRGRDDRPRQDGGLGEIRVVHGGFAGGGESNSSRKAHLRKLKNEDPVEVYAVERSARHCRPDSEEVPIIFSQEDELGTVYPHDDPLVVSMIVANFKMNTVLIDSGSSADVLFLTPYDQL